MQARSTIRSAAIALGLALAVLTLAVGAGIAAADDQRPAGQAKDPEVVTGNVTKIDPEKGRVTIRGADGGVHEFEASKETLDDLKVGKRIEAKKRPGQ